MEDEANYNAYDQRLKVSEQSVPPVSSLALTLVARSGEGEYHRCFQVKKLGEA